MGQAQQAQTTADISDRGTFSRFFLRDGRTLCTLEDLAHALETLSPEMFNHHVDDSCHDFASWIQDTLGDDDLALAVTACKTSQTMRSVILSHLGKDAHHDTQDTIVVDVPPPADLVCDTSQGPSEMGAAAPEVKESASSVTIDEGSIANKKGITSWWEKWRQGKQIESLAEWEADLSVREAGITKERREIVSHSRILTAREDHLRRRYAHVDEVQMLSALMQKKAKTKKGEHPADGV